MAEEKGLNSMKLRTKVIMLILCPLLVVAICSGVIVFYSQTLITDGVYEFETEPPAVMTAVENSDDAVLKYLDSLIDKAASSDEIAVKSENTAEITDIGGTLTDAQKNVLDFAKAQITAKGIEKLNSVETDYGETPPAIPDIYVSGADKTDISCERPEEDNDENQYLIKIEASGFGALPEKDSDVYRAFCMDEDSAAKAAILEAFSSTADVTELNVNVEALNVEAKSGCADDKISSMTVKRSYKVSAHVSFKGELAELGGQDIEFTYISSKNYEFSWAGLGIEQDAITINKNGYDNLSLKTNVSDKATAGKDFTLTFISSDENILKADANGMVEAIAESEKPVTVTARLEYLGHVYEDTCEVYVIDETKGIKCDTKEVTLTAGSVTKLSAAATPDSATIKTILWFSDDENIAKVGEDGSVTAVSAGKTTVYAVTEYGHYKAAITVTVTQ